jgi:hypothetical protein
MSIMTRTGGAVCGGVYTGSLPAASWNVLRFTKTGRKGIESGN